MSHQEGTVWGSVIAMVVVYGYYFATLLASGRGAGVGAADLVRLTLAVIVFVGVQVVYHIVVHIVTAVKSRQEPRGKGQPLIEADERDRLIEAKGEKIGSLLLGTGVILTIGSIVAGGLSETGRSPSAFTPFMTAHTLLLSLVVAEIGKGVTQLFHYRRGF